MENKKRLASRVGTPGICTVVLIDKSQRPIMNLHKVPLSATVWAIKSKVSERLKEVGRSLSAEVMLLHVESGGTSTEMTNDECLSTYNTLGISRFTVIISRRTKVELEVVLSRPEKKCLCITKQKKEQEEFPVNIPLGYSTQQLRLYITETMNCDVQKKDFKLFYDEAMQDAFPEEGTMRSLGLADKTRLHALMPPGFDISKIQYPVLDAKKAGAAPTTEPETLTEAAPAAVAGSEKTQQEKDFDARAKGGSMPQQDAGDYARSLGFAPSNKEIASLPEKVDYKTFQDFLGVAMHPDDTQESFRSFFSSFDTQATGDLSKKQVCNILQMWGEEPLSPAEAAAFCELAMGKENTISITVLIDMLQEGTA
ncbi:myosin light chain 2, putative [Toxoplasma gondii ME49]|uniref:Myosin light chain 2, putative n=1 Tax=Toxoplasma gondii (strain ATCC 50611 / Me49) TaxID=508771 RepID=S8FBF7_TOXGM|nr:myosin light chain 2, putative [Toxoplasma gondii ME49]EPT32167.1 myosin light chain 2, putative [Toxoplasma gondii ME49]|eukprot:XP_002371177.1 myosin light chain 2, putative [Toxoplasma gondii ME49]